MQADGYSLDDKRNKIDKSDLQDIVKQYTLRGSLSGVETPASETLTRPKKSLQFNY